MARKPRFSTLWEVPYQLWELISAILEKHEPRKPTGRPRVDRRRTLERGILVDGRGGPLSVLVAGANVQLSRPSWSRV